MPVRFCITCWAENLMDATTCWNCGKPLAARESNGITYVDKLLAALHHPEPETRVRAAMILGTVADPGDARVCRALVSVLALDAPERATHDAGLQTAAARSLGQLGACETSAQLRELAMRDTMPLIAGLGAVEALAQLAHNGCDQACEELEHIAREASRRAIRAEASTNLARLNEPG
jgi:hypothetical protein